MDRKKPALTAPWKVGFLVALLLTVTSIGVSYFITGTFGVTWHWLEINGPSPAQWAFNPGAFLEEMAPLIALTGLLAFGAFVLVAGAVRRYKAQTDNGADYRQLLKSIKSIEDLEDDEVLEQLRKYPELREFVLGIRNRVMAHERQNGERDRRPPEAAGNGHRGHENSNLGAECAILASAAINGRDGFARELALTIPELKQIERAVRQALIATATPAPAVAPAPVAADVARVELASLRGAVRGAVLPVREDANACAAGAREVEQMIVSLRQAVEAMPGPGGKGADAPALLAQVDAIATALSGLGEETRRIAIAAALQASGGADTDAIRVADEVRAIATRFNGVAGQWKQLAPALRGAIEPGAGAGARERAAVIATLGAVASKTSQWSERTAALGAQVRAIEKVVGIDAGVDAPPAPRYEPARAEEQPAAAMAAQSARTDTAGAVAAKPAVETTPEPEGVAFSDPTAVSLADDGDEIVNAAVPGVFEETASASEDVQFAEIPGFEKEHRIFVEPETADARADIHANFDVEHTDEPAAEVEDAAGGIDALADAPDAPAATAPRDGFLTGPRADEPAEAPAREKKADTGPARPAPTPVRDEDRVEFARPARPRPHPAGVSVPETTTVTATLEPAVDADADAIDLYALGAVDYADA